MCHFSKMKIYCFPNGLPRPFQDKINSEELKTLDDIIQKENHFYKQLEAKVKPHKAWKTERPLECWGCVGEQQFREFPHKNKRRICHLNCICMDQ